MALLLTLLLLSNNAHAMEYNEQNMNGLYYVASGGNQDTKFNSDYASKGHEYFDVYSPEIATHYGDVFWHDQGKLDLPAEIVQRFAGKVIAITGYEQDQVMVQDGKPDVSVPINWAYNHHYMAWMTGKYSTLEEVPTTEEDMWYWHGKDTKMVAVETPEAANRADTKIPVSQLFSEGNGGESRKSFHGYPDGYAQLIESPQSWHITPMQIDTRNRECGVTPESVTNCTQFTPGLEPKQARYGRPYEPKTGSNYSGLLECPCNGKFGGAPLFYGNDTKTKVVIHNFETLQTSQCSAGEAIETAISCFNAVSNMGFPSKTKVETQTVSSTEYPTGCSIQKINKDGNDIISAVFNTLSPSKSAECSTATQMSGVAISDIGVSIELSLNTIGSDNGDIPFVHSPSGQYCSLNQQNVLSHFPAASNAESDQFVALQQCEAFCGAKKECTACSVDCSLYLTESTGHCQWNALPQCGKINSFKGPIGLIPGDISYKNMGTVNMTISGPADVWFGVGFNARNMADQPYSILVNSTAVWEQRIGTCGSEADHCPGTTLNTSIRVLSNTVNGNVRTVHIERDGLIGIGDDYFSFRPSTQGTVDLITAVGSSQTYSYHKGHSNTAITMIMSSGSTCVCDTGANGKLCEADGTECKQFVKNCVASSTSATSPDGDLLTQKNPTCNSRQYSGGLSCCRDGHNLLDADQEIPEELLRYHMKFRFWFQEYKADNGSGVPTHYNLDRIYQQTEANAGEYDIPPAFALDNLPVVGYEDWPKDQPTPGTTCTGTCPDGDDCECVHTIHYKWVESPNRPMRLIYAGGHCHAPACISLELFRNDTGELLCAQIPRYGEGNVHEDKYDEAGYIAIPPCLWGDDHGLEPSVLLPAGTPLYSVKKNRNTKVGHFGEMASWQMRGVFF